MAARFSASGKRIGRPPKTPPASASPAPQDANNVAVAKALQSFRARYDAAGRGRRMTGWNPPASGPNAALQGLQTIRNRSRDAGRNDWAGESSVQKWATALIGIGIKPRFPRIKSKARKTALVDLFDDFVQQADADGVLNLYAQQTLVVRSWLESGEVFARRRNRFLDEGFPVPMQVQLLEAEMVPLLDATSYKGLPEGHQIISGIEVNRRGRRVAYWVYKQHPGDAQSADVGPEALVRVLAQDMIHVFEQKRPGQMRGVSALAPVLARLRNIGDYEDTTLERQKIANLWVGFISRTLPTLDPNDINAGALTGVEQPVDSLGDPLVPLRPGLIQELEDGQTFDFANPPEAGTTYSDYLRTSHLGTAAAAGLPYELFSGDIREVSDRTLRVLVNDFRRFAEQRQWQTIIPQFCQRVVDWFVEAAVLSGKIAVDEADDARHVEHAPHGWAYIHPVQDVQGKAMEVNNGFRSRSSVIGERGDDPDQVDDERAIDQQREMALGLPTGGVPPAAPADPDEDKNPGKEGDDDGIDDDEYTAPPNPTQAHLAELAQIEARTELLRAQARKLAEPTMPDSVTATNQAIQMRILGLLGSDDGQQ